jgi:hypothetical protein
MTPGRNTHVPRSPLNHANSTCYTHSRLRFEMGSVDNGARLTQTSILILREPLQKVNGTTLACHSHLKETPTNSRTQRHVIVHDINSCSILQSPFMECMLGG